MVRKFIKMCLLKAEAFSPPNLPCCGQKTLFSSSVVHAFPPSRIRDEVYVPAVVTPAFEGNQGGFRRGALLWLQNSRRSTKLKSFIRVRLSWPF